MCDYFELDRIAGRYRWRLKEKDNTLIAQAARSQANKPAALDDIALVRRLAATAGFHVYGGGGKYRWRLRDEGDVLITKSAMGFTRAGAHRAAARARRAIATAVLRDLTGETDAPYNLGVLPPGLAVQWPQSPEIMRETVITRAEAPVLRLEQPNTRYVIRANFSEITVQASHVELQVDAGFQVGRAFIDISLNHISFVGGNYREIEFRPPFDFNSPTPQAVVPGWVITDVLFDRVNVDSTSLSAGAGNAFSIRGVRVAIIRSRVRARDYAVWVGEGAFTSTDLILAGNECEAVGGQAAVRLYPVERAVVVENRLTCNERHSYRVHGPSRLVYAARNTLINGGVMLIDHAMPPHPDQPWVMDDHDQIWLVDNIFQQRRAEMLDVGRPDNLGPGLRHFTFTGNRIASPHEIHREQLTNLEAHPPETWAVQDNHIEVVTV